ncbi:hypothetical protein PFISCL1PPCAC_14247, partial [Pristionchus fissidentatus]
QELGVPFLFRKLAASLTVTSIIKREGKKWTFVQESAFKTCANEFELDKEFEEHMADGRNFMTTVTLTPDNKLISRQRKIKSEDKESIFTRFLEDN